MVGNCLHLKVKCVSLMHFESSKLKALMEKSLIDVTLHSNWCGSW